MLWVLKTKNMLVALQHETGLCKNMLQEYAQKMNYAIPSYVCTRRTVGPAPYICTVEIGGIQYIGAAATTKKEAEIKAARTALLAIQRKIDCWNLSDFTHCSIPFLICIYSLSKNRLPNIFLYLEIFKRFTWHLQLQ